MSINSTVGKWSILNPHTGVLHNNKNNQVTDMHKNMDESHKLNIELKKLCTKDECMLCDSAPKIMESFPQTFNGKSWKSDDYYKLGGT